MEEITRKVNEKFMRQFESYCICLHFDPPPELKPFVPLTGKFNNFFLEVMNWINDI